MATLAVQSELIARAVMFDLEMNIADALEEVSAFWTLQDLSMLLDNPATLTFGFEENLINLTEDMFPRIAILAAPVNPEAEGSNARVADAIHTLLLEWHVLKPTANDATVASWRYGQAIAAVLRNKGPWVGFDMLNIVPTVSEGQALRHRGNNTSLDVRYIAGGVASWRLKGRYTA